MAKFVRGPFSTVEEVKEALQQLRQEGYNSQYITVVANEEKDIRALENETAVEVKQEDAEDLGGGGGHRTIWEQLADTFSGFFFNEDYTKRKPTSEEGDDGEDADPSELLSGYRQDLENGKIVLLVEDIRNKDAEFDLDAAEKIYGQDSAENHSVRSKNSSASSVEEIEERDADPSRVMDEITPERDSHPDIEDDEDILTQETPYVPTDEADDSDDSIIDTHVIDVEETAVPTDDPGLTADDVSDIEEDPLVGVPLGEPDSIPTDVTAVETDLDNPEYKVNRTAEELTGRDAENQDENNRK